jgi:outer membrane protein
MATMKHSLIASAALVAAGLLAAPGPAYGQVQDVRVRVGLGGQVRPEFPGADDREFAPVWDIDVARGTNEFKFEAPDDQFGIALFSKDGFALGPAANLSNSRKDKDVGAPLGKVPTTFEAGAFAEYYAGKSFRLRAELLKGIGGHDGLIGSVGADQFWRDGDRYVVSIGPRLLFSDSRYQRAYFGISPAAALASGLPAYRPSSGIHAVALASGLSYQFNPRWGLFGFGRYERLVGDAAKSPIVRDLGSRNQLSAGAGLSYTFTLDM